jgi:hypothetical protein
MPYSDDQKCDFALEEFKSLRSEIASTLKAYGDLERLAVGSCAAIYAWLAKDATSALWVAWWVPAFVAVLAAFRAYGLYHRLIELGAYVYETEKEIYQGCGEGEVKGWEHFREGHARIQNSMISRSAFAVWILLNIITVLVGVYFTFHHNGRP